MFVVKPRSSSRSNGWGALGAGLDPAVHAIGAKTPTAARGVPEPSIGAGEAPRMRSAPVAGSGSYPVHWFLELRKIWIGELVARDL
jgi:hypothetical protein